jgi:hypothetical protein
MKFGRMGIPRAGPNSIQLGPSDSTVSADAGTEPWAVATFALVLETLKHSVRSHPHLLQQLHIQQLQLTDQEKF